MVLLSAYSNLVSLCIHRWFVSESSWIQWPQLLALNCLRVHCIPMSSTMTVSSTSGITALLCSIVISVAVAQSEPRFRLKILTDSPTARSNFLRLQCQDGELGFLSNPDTLVWLNSTNLVDKTPVEDSYNDGQRVSVFIITQELEGVYTCGLPAPDGVNRPESAPQLILREFLYLAPVGVCLLNGKYLESQPGLHS